MTTRHTEDWEKEFIEQGAALEHSRWAGWQEYFFSKCEIKPQSQVGGMDDGYIYFALIKSLNDRWERQIKTPYGELSEEEKESDRIEVRKYLPLISQAIASARREEREKILKNVKNLQEYWLCIGVDTYITYKVSDVLSLLEHDISLSDNKEV